MRALPFAAFALLLPLGCAYSSSETPRPLEPDYERAVQEKAAKKAHPGLEGEGATSEETERRALAPSSWGR